MLIQILNGALILLFTLIVILSIKNLLFLYKSETTEGVVVDRGVLTRLGAETNQQGNLSSEARDKGQTFTVIEFTTKNGEKKQLDHTNIGVSIGDTFTVRYDPKNPGRAHVDNPVNVWIQVMLLGVVFLVVLIARFVV